MAPGGDGAALFGAVAADVGRGSEAEKSDAGVCDGDEPCGAGVGVDG